VAYAVQADLEGHYGQLEVERSAERAADRNHSDIPTAVTKALTTATSEIDSYVGVVHDLPLLTVPSRLVDICCDIGLYRLSYDAGMLTEEKRLRYEDAIKWLTNLSKGIVDLGLPAADEPPSTELVEVASSTRLFTRSTMRRLM
jgi:phage gp36-like protein